MKKQSAIIKAYWQRALTYRFEVMMYRVGEMGEMIALILMWTAIYGDQDLIRGFSIREMITYILIGNLFNAMIRNLLTGIVSADIKEGRLSVFFAYADQLFSICHFTGNWPDFGSHIHVRYFPVFNHNAFFRVVYHKRRWIVSINDSDNGNPGFFHGASFVLF